MRFCPFCSAENADESAVCSACGRRLPPLPPRRAGSKGPPTGVQLPPRAGSPVPPRKPPTLPPPIPSAAVPIEREFRDSAPALPPPPPSFEDQATEVAAELRNAIDPGPAAQRREAPPIEAPTAGGPTRR